MEEPPADHDPPAYLPEEKVSSNDTASPSVQSKPLTVCLSRFAPAGSPKPGSVVTGELQAKQFDVILIPTNISYEALNILLQERAKTRGITAPTLGSIVYLGISMKPETGLLAPVIKIDQTNWEGAREILFAKSEITMNCSFVVAEKGYDERQSELRQKKARADQEKKERKAKRGCVLQ